MPRPTYADCGEKTLGHISDDDPDEESDGVRPTVAEGQSDDEEDHCKADSDDDDELNETRHLESEGRRCLLHF